MKNNKTRLLYSKETMNCHEKICLQINSSIYIFIVNKKYEISCSFYKSYYGSRDIVIYEK